jgi:hypothetical protein
MTKLGEIEIFAGRYWFTKWDNGRGIVKGPFTTKREAEQAQTKYRLEEAACQINETKSQSSSSQSSPSECSSPSSSS